MTIGELKISTLQLIDNNGTDLVVSDIGAYEDDDNYAPYLRAFKESLNGCLSRITTEKKTPLKSLEMKITSNTTTYGLDVNDIYEIEYVSFINHYGHQVNMSYSLIGSSHIEVNGFDGKAIIYYHRMLPILEDDNSIDLNKIGVSDNLASIIKYYIKAEVFEGEEPGRAMQARNIFENYLGNIKSTTYEKKQTSANTWWNICQK